MPIIYSRRVASMFAEARLLIHEAKELYRQASDKLRLFSYNPICFEMWKKTDKAQRSIEIVLEKREEILQRSLELGIAILNQEIRFPGYSSLNKQEQVLISIWGDYLTPAMQKLQRANEILKEIYDGQPTWRS